MTLNLGMHPQVLEYYHFAQMMTLGWLWPILRQGQIWSLMLLYGKKVKQWIFQKLQYCRLWFETSNRWPKWLEVSVDVKTLSPGGCKPPALGLHTCIKSWKNCIKSLQRDVFETCTKWVKWQRLSADIKILSPGSCLPLPLGYIHVLDHEKIV